YLPIRTEFTSGMPRCCIASRTAAPCGSSTAAFGVTRTLTFMSQYSESVRSRQVQSSIRRALTLHFGWLLIFAQSQEHRLPQFPVARPFGEFHLANENRIHPVNFSHHRWRDPLHPLAALFRWKVGERAIVSLPGLQFLVQRCQRFRVESRPNFPRKQKFLFVVVPHEHRAEMLPRALRRGESADDEFLLVDALEFDPRA